MREDDRPFDAEGRCKVCNSADCEVMSHWEPDEFDIDLADPYWEITPDPAPVRTAAPSAPPPNPAPVLLPAPFSAAPVPLTAAIDIKDKSGSESYMHGLAKQVFCTWLREAAAKAGLNGTAKLFTASPWGGISWRVNRPGPNWGAYMEFPHCGWNGSWDEHGAWLERCGGWGRREPTPGQIQQALVKAGQQVPTYGECLEMGESPVTISDLAILQQGRVTTVVEIYHTHKIERSKLEYLWDHGIEVHEVPAEWVMRQRTCPDKMPDFRLVDRRPKLPVRVYFAGKITKDRDTGWRPGVCAMHEEPRRDRFGVDNSVRTGLSFGRWKGRELLYTGPFVYGCDHGCYHGATSHGQGAFADLHALEHCAGTCGACGEGSHDEPSLILRRSYEGVKAADLVLAKPTRDSFGTLVEIGWAIALGKSVVVDTDDPELWFAKQGAQCKPELQALADMLLRNPTQVQP